MDANLCSPASSDMRKTYSGAVTWFDLCVLPELGWTKRRMLTCPDSGIWPGSAIIQSIQRIQCLLTELLYSSVCTPRQLKGHVDSAPLVLHATVSLQGYTRAGSFRDDGYELIERKDSRYYISHRILELNCYIRIEYILKNLILQFFRIFKKSKGLCCLNPNISRNSLNITLEDKVKDFVRLTSAMWLLILSESL